MDDQEKRKILERVQKDGKAVVTIKEGKQFKGLCTMDDITDAESPAEGEMLLSELTPAGLAFLKG